MNANNREIDLRISNLSANNRMNITTTNRMINRYNSDFDAFFEANRDIKAVYCSSNHIDVYLFLKGYSQSNITKSIILPEKVDVKLIEILFDDDNNIVRRYTLIANNNYPDNSLLVFEEKKFKNVDKSYIVLANEYNRGEQDTFKFCYETNYRGDITKLESCKQLKFHYTFSLKEFMNEWESVKMKNHDDIHRPDYLLEYSRIYSTQPEDFPMINVLKCMTKDSPIYGANYSKPLFQIKSIKDTDYTDYIKKKKDETFNVESQKDIKRDEVIKSIKSDDDDSYSDGITFIDTPISKDKDKDKDAHDNQTKFNFERTSSSSSSSSSKNKSSKSKYQSHLGQHQKKHKK